MSRDDGFLRADTDTALYSDPKVRRLWRLIRPDSMLMATAMCVYEQTRLASWRTGERVAAEDAVEDWLVDPAPPVSRLREAGLLDEQSKIPSGAWLTWYGVARERRDHSREYWTAKKRAQRARSTGDDEGGLPETNARSTGDKRGVPATNQPTIHPTVHSSRAGARAREAAPTTPPASRGSGGLTSLHSLIPMIERRG